MSPRSASRHIGGEKDAREIHVLCLAHYFPPETGALAARMSEHAAEWSRGGARVTIVTCAPNYPNGRVFPGYRNRLFQRERVGDLEVIRLWTFLAANEGFFLRTLNYLSFALSVLIMLPLLPRPDVVFSTSPNLFCGLSGWFVSRLKRRPWVLEIRDLWPDSIIAVGALKNRFLLAPFAALERFAYRHADRIVCVTDSFVSKIVERGAVPEKVHVVKNGADLKAFSIGSGIDFRAQYALGGKVVASYVGTLGMAHRLENVLHAAEILKGRPEVAILVVGDGAERQRLERMQRTMGLPNVIFTGGLPRHEMAAVMEATDIALVHLAKTPLFRSVIPSKMFEAMAMRRPIVLAVEGESKAIIDRAGAGLTIEPEDPQALADALAHLADSPELRQRMGDAGRRCVSAEFDRQKLANKLLRILAEAANASNAAKPTRYTQ
ncbi:glycosyltransferase family 4 protein [Sinorhizobium meliloti]|uniref:glycosyltransferase family 4 protein n=1 Tax=Rhizobium meliloti TaxID=382 RepID=UPI002090A013|nr:glycosyltransferase family 4 protein [Sinorhizobium meliloti]MCO5965396.1 glycosyltransferase family 4 protein [Sinorhizobium meliloti]